MLQILQSLIPTTYNPYPTLHTLPYKLDPTLQTLPHSAPTYYPHMCNENEITEYDCIRK